MDRASTAGQLAGIAVRSQRRARMCEVTEATVIAGAGLVGDHKGDKFPGRGVSILGLDDWARAIAELTDLAGPVPLPWTVRRANLLVKGVRLPRARGAIIEIGVVRLEVTAQTYPCKRMEEAHPGLLRALALEWRGGVSCRVLTGGVIRAGDVAKVVSSPPERVMKLP